MLQIGTGKVNLAISALGIASMGHSLNHLTTEHQEYVDTLMECLHFIFKENQMKHNETQQECLISDVVTPMRLIVFDYCSYLGDDFDAI